MGAQQSQPKWTHRPNKVLGKANQANKEFHRKNTYQGEGGNTILVIVDLIRSLELSKGVSYEMHS